VIKNATALMHDDGDDDELSQADEEQQQQTSKRVANRTESLQQPIVVVSQ
jgi:hypothetical protein